jgi:ribosomal protein L3 glutamine methyltransferase
MTLEDCIAEAAQRMESAGAFFGHGTDNAWDEAAWLVLHALAMPVTQQADLAMPLDDEQLSAARKLVEQRIRTRKPAAYLTGTAWFAGLPFDTAEGVIVPRSHLAGFLMDQGRPWLDPAEVHHVLDMCTGSACIAIATAALFPDVQVDATDIDPLALQLARRNASKHALEDRVRIVESDLYANMPGQYDLILSNPPYVPSSTLTSLPPEYRYEPTQAFDGGVDGLDLVHHIIDAAHDHLTENGVLVMEVGDSWQALQKSRPMLPFIWLETDVEDSGLFLLYARDLADAAKHQGAPE